MGQFELTGSVGLIKVVALPFGRKPVCPARSPCGAARRRDSSQVHGICIGYRRIVGFRDGAGKPSLAKRRDQLRSDELSRHLDNRAPRRLKAIAASPPEVRCCDNRAAQMVRQRNVIREDLNGGWRRNVCSCHASRKYRRRCVGCHCAREITGFEKFKHHLDAR